MANSLLASWSGRRSGPGFRPSKFTAATGRGINTYSSFLREDDCDKPDADGQAKLHALQKLTRRREALIKSLLMYSRVGRTKLAV